MNYYRCRCGEKIAEFSHYPPPCVGCKKCKTTLAQSSDDHRTIINHIYDETNACIRCGKLKKEQK